MRILGLELGADSSVVKGRSDAVVSLEMKYGTGLVMVGFVKSAYRYRG